MKCAQQIKAGLDVRYPLINLPKLFNLKKIESTQWTLVG